MNKNQNNMMRYDTQQKQERASLLKKELEKIMTRRLRQNLDGPTLTSKTQSAIQLLDSKPKIYARDTDQEALKRLDKLKVQVEVIGSKLENVVFYQNTLR